MRRRHGDAALARRARRVPLSSDGERRVDIRNKLAATTSSSQSGLGRLTHRNAVDSDNRRRRCPTWRIDRLAEDSRVSYMYSRGGGHVSNAIVFGLGAVAFLSLTSAQAASFKANGPVASAHPTNTDTELSTSSLFDQRPGQASGAQSSTALPMTRASPRLALSEATGDKVLPDGQVRRSNASSRSDDHNHRPLGQQPPISVASSSAEPEPGTYVLMLAGLGVVALIAQRRRFR
jgi:hypothetical protein